MCVACALVPIEDYQFQMATQQGDLKAAVWTNQTLQTLASRNYNAGMDIYWRFRESAGRTYCETSVDGSSWDVLWEKPSRTTLAGSHFRLVAGVEAFSMVPPGGAHIAGVNVTP